MKGWMEEVRQLADQYTDPQSASMKRALFKISFSFFLMPTILITYKMFLLWYSKWEVVCRTKKNIFS